MLFFSFYFLCYSFKTGVELVPEKAPEDFTPVVRFAVCSDIHLGKGMEKNEVKFRKLFDATYEYAGCQDYKRLDALMVCGDMTESGKESEYDIFMNIINEKMKKETTLLSCTGNHEFGEYRDTESPEKAFEVYEKHIKRPLDTHEVIGGYHFIGISYDVDRQGFKEKAQWTKEQLDIAVADTGNKPIFVFQHPHPTLTVYGSVNWGDYSFRKAIQGYPQVVDFSGHSHYAANDPRSISQGAFTSIGTGGITGSMGNLNYINGDKYGKIESGTFYIVEADKDGNIRLKLYDLCSDMFFEDREIYLSKDNDRRYTWSNSRSLDTKPQFPDGTKITASKNKDGETILNFPAAKGCYPAESYRVTVTSGKLKVVYTETLLSGYTRADYKEENISIGKLEEGKYTVYVTSYSPYAKKGGTLKAEITV